MKLYLSSYRIPTPEDFYELTGKSENIKAAIITNAKDNRDPVESKQKTDSLLAYLGDLGVVSTLIDLRKLNTQSVVPALQDYDVIYGHGGNTFNLRQAMAVSGFDVHALELLEDREIVYVGESAGAIVMGSTLKGFETVDGLEEVRGDVVWDGLSLVNKVIVPHADSPDFSDRVAPLQKMYPDAIVLNDNQALVVNGGHSRVVSG
jgi:dipeptidase E